MIILQKLRKLEASDRRLAALVKNSNDAIAILSPEGDITAWNKGAEIMYGWSEPEALRMNIRDITPTDQKRQALSRIKLALKAEVASFKTKRLTRNGKILDVWVTATKLVDRKGEVTGITTTERDITTLKEKRRLL